MLRSKYVNENKRNKRDLIIIMAEEQVKALEKGDIESFMQWFRVDPYEEYYVKRWFSGYTVKVVNPKDCVMQSLQINEHSDCLYDVLLLIALHYEKYDTEIAIFQYKVKYNSELENISIIDSYISLKNENQFYNPLVNKRNVNGNIETNKKLLFSSIQENSIKWWKDEEIIDLCKNSRETIKANLYTRSITKSVRFRNTHPEIDCAAILSDMMSYRSAALAYFFKSGSIEELIMNVHEFAKINMKLRTSEVGNQTGYTYTVQELSLLPQHNIDELYALKKEKLPVEASCVEITNFYINMLRLGGMKSENIFVTIQPFHYLTYFKIGNSYYIENTNEIMRMSPKRLYGDTDVSRIVSPIYYLDASGQTNIPKEVLSNLYKKYEEGIPIFKLPEASSKQNILPFEADKDINVNNCVTPMELHKRFKKYVFEMSMKHPDSPFTWAIYSYQTLMVKKPQVYILSSLKSQEVKMLSSKLNTLEVILDWIRGNIKEGSIFLEEERIMTADQTIRHKKGSPKDKAMLLSVLSYFNCISEESEVIVTDIGAYAVLYKNSKYNIFDCNTLTQVNEIEGSVIVAFSRENNWNVWESASEYELNEK
ncbi:hypothetical protein acsn021_24150 [Anaerocolumna cellulosilytica]|uniref:Uncharacterized protein n=1 Tax=Anaerocolumna cellulosilytica TaxID=433286 RepID=A0A6S6QYK9_9FIRM|nr:hypothetical protein [Anaerocolumna cellulosilytica]MBB5193940.1 hypothetical protein [Anaerocolumna cellulosilytica]BCJ94846.1 hypothetical protein acsn021_24150 [Anaerocolumna cellulosilytica]